MTLGIDVSIVMPVFNEGATIEQVLREIDKSVETRHEVVVVYDFEGDDTVPVCEALKTEIDGIRLHPNERGRGALNAMISGIESCDSRFVVTMMADGSDEAEAIDQMVALAQARGAGVVAASRYMKGGRQIGGPKLKSLMSRSAGLSLYYGAGLPIHDPTSNFKLYSGAFLASIEIESRAGFELALELSTKAFESGWQLAEVPTTWHDRTAGESHFELRKWLPEYLRWYVFGMRAGIRKRLAA